MRPRNDKLLTLLGDSTEPELRLVEEIDRGKGEGDGGGSRRLIRFRGNSGDRIVPFGTVARRPGRDSEPAIRFAEVRIPPYLRKYALQTELDALQRWLGRTPQAVPVEVLPGCDLER